MKTINKLWIFYPTGKVLSIPYYFKKSLRQKKKTKKNIGSGPSWQSFLSILLPFVHSCKVLVLKMPIDLTEDSTDDEVIIMKPNATSRPKNKRPIDLGKKYTIL